MCMTPAFGVSWANDHDHDTGSLPSRPHEQCQNKRSPLSTPQEVKPLPFERRFDLPRLEQVASNDYNLSKRPTQKGNLP